MQTLRSPNGLTVTDLKQMLADCDTDSRGWLTILARRGTGPICRWPACVHLRAVSWTTR